MSKRKKKMTSDFLKKQALPSVATRLSFGFASAAFGRLLADRTFPRRDCEGDGKSPLLTVRGQADSGRNRSKTTPVELVESAERARG